MRPFDLLTFLLCCLLQTSSWATFYSPIFGEKSDLVVIHDADTDLAARIEIIKNAKYSVEILSHSHTAGVMGQTMSMVIRDALQRGVKVKYLYEQTWGFLGGDFANTNLQLLTDNSLPQQAEVIQVPILKKILSSPFSFFHFFHQKVIIADRGTENEVILAGGRNHDEAGLKWADLSYVIRRVLGLPQGEKTLATDIISHFDTTWELAKKYYPIERARKVSKKIQAIVDNFSYPKLSPVMAILNTLQKPVIPGENLQEFQFRPSFARLVTNDALQRIEDKKLNNKNGSAEVVSGEDDITSYLAGYFDAAKRVELSTYIMMLPTQLMSSLKGVVSRNGEAVIYSNNKESFRRVAPVPGMGKIAESYSYETTMNLISEPGQDKNVQVYLFDANLADQSEQIINYHHRKLALIEIRSEVAQQSKYFSWLGSYNFTNGSADKSDEMGFMVQDAHLYSYLSKVNREEGERFHVSVNPTEAAKLAKQGQMMRNLCRRAFTTIF